MTISYKWISEYIPLSLEPEKISRILTSIGLEVESLEPYESIRGGLEGLVVGEVKSCRPHPGADRLKLTEVDTGNGHLLRIVCGAANVAEGQKVIVARTGVTIHPVKGEPVTMKTAKIRGEESEGMICAEDEIGLGDRHEGIMVLESDLKPGTPLKEIFQVYTDWIYEIGLTPNRMDAMSHLGVARDVCAWLSHHEKKDVKVRIPEAKGFKVTGSTAPFGVSIMNTKACSRYTGILLEGISVQPSPLWLRQRLGAIGVRPINNIVDLTNFILHDTGQPLHAFDADKIAGGGVIIDTLPEGTPFVALDGKEIKLAAEDLMICDTRRKPLCIAGVYGGADSGVTASTTRIFLESAWFDPVFIRKTSFRHRLRTDAAARFEKNVDISNTLQVLKRAAVMMVDLAGGTIASEWVDQYPEPEDRREVVLTFHYLKKLSGKNYHPDTVKRILQGLGFGIKKEGYDDILLEVPYSKPDITLQADVIEEIMRIDGYDNIPIPGSITITPSTGAGDPVQVRKEKTAGYLVGAGFSEIFTNSITNADYFEAAALEGSVRMLNNLSAVHNIMRPSMLETGLESVAYNLNRKNADLKFFEFGKTYRTEGPGRYHEEEHLALYVTGMARKGSWKGKGQEADLFYLKGIAESVSILLGSAPQWVPEAQASLSGSLVWKKGDTVLAVAGIVSRSRLERFDIRQPVYYADLRWNRIIENGEAADIRFQPLPNQLPVSRDLAMVVADHLPFQDVSNAISRVGLDRLQSVQLFDVFESEKIGAGKKSLAVNFTFLDSEKTLTDQDIDTMMNRIMRILKEEIGAEIRTGA